MNVKIQGQWNDWYPYSLATFANALESSIDHVSTKKLQVLFSEVKRELTTALYLGLNWVFPDGSWTKSAPAWGQTSFRSERIKTILEQISKHDSPDTFIDQLFEQWRKNFDDGQYKHVRNLFRLYRILSKSVQFNQAVIEILVRIPENTGIKTVPPLITSNNPEYYWFFNR